MLLPDPSCPHLPLGRPSSLPIFRRTDRTGGYCCSTEHPTPQYTVPAGEPRSRRPSHGRHLHNDQGVSSKEGNCVATDDAVEVGSGSGREPIRPRDDRECDFVILEMWMVKLEAGEGLVWRSSVSCLRSRNCEWVVKPICSAYRFIVVLGTSLRVEERPKTTRVVSVGTPSIQRATGRLSS